MSKSRKAKSLALLLALAFVFTSLFSSIGAVAFAAEDGTRLYGGVREATAVEISKEGWEESDDVVLVNGYAYPDALAAGPLAQKLDAPILLTDKDVLPDVTKAEIDRLGAETVYIVGGIGVVPDSVAKATGKTVVRLGEKDRYETAVAVAEKLKELGVSTEKVVIARGDDYPDALAAAAVKPAMPILFAGKAEYTSLVDATEDALTDLGVKDAVIVGDTGVVSAEIEEQIDAIVGNVTRIGEADRFKTAVAIANAFKPADGYKGAVLATGYGYADALAGGPYAAKNGYALLLTGNARNPIDSAVIDFIKANTGIKADTIVALGGPTVVLDAAIAAAVEAATPAALQVVSVSAINGKTVEIKFNKTVKKDTVISSDKLINITFTAIGGAPGVTSASAGAALSADGKTLTITPAGDEYFDGDYAVVVNTNVKDVDGAAIIAYSAICSLKDTARPAISSVTYPINGVARVTFTEPVKVADASEIAGALYIQDKNGASVSATGLVTLADDKKSFDLNIAGFATGEPYTVTLVGIADYSGKLISPNPSTFTVVKGTVDDVKPTVVSVKSLDIGKLQVTFSEKLSAYGSYTVDGGTATDITVGTNATVDDTGTILTITDTPQFAAGVKSIKFSGYKDLSGNIGDDYTKVVQFTADATKPAYVSHEVKNIDNTLYLIVKYNENVAPVGGSITGTYVDANQVTKPVTILATTGTGGTLSLYDPDNDGVSDSVKISLAADQPVGTYTVTIPAGLVEDVSAAGNDSIAKTITFAVGSVGDTGKPSVTSYTIQTIEDKVTVKFSEPVSAATALNTNNYTVEGAYVFSNAIFDGDQQTVTLTLKPNVFPVSGPRSFTISGVADVAGNVMDAKTTIATFKENVKPTIKSAALTNATTITVTFSEPVSIDANAFEYYIDGVKQVAVDGTTTLATNTAISVGSEANTLVVTVPEINDLSKNYQLKLVSAAKDANGNTSATGILVTVQK
ncbi:MAG: hypothetical protein PWP55_464 [Clostridiales bacterium]|nr:hypothetical protein [Clostridiales bacterium]